MSQPSTRDRLWAVRGAVCADANDEASILDATTQLMTELMARNQVALLRRETGRDPAHPDLIQLRQLVRDANADQMNHVRYITRES